MKIAVDQIKNWIFVTGEIRGGTTFVGMMLSLPWQVDYIHEPFNIRCGMPGMRARWQYVKPTLETAPMRTLHEAASRIFRYDFSLRNSPFEKDPFARKLIKQLVGTRGPYYLRLAKLNPFHRHAVIKDPTGALMTEYLHVHFGVQPVIVIRHPLSFVASLKRVNWWPDVHKLVRQDTLFRDYLASNPAFWETNWKDPIESASAHWRLLHTILRDQANRYPGWTFVKLEEVSQYPIQEFKRLYKNLALPWSEAVERRILKMTKETGSGEARGNRVQDLKRNSSRIFDLRIDSLNAKERRRVFDIVKEIALDYYDEASFRL